MLTNGHHACIKTPQPFPYQGSKRNLGPAILPYIPSGIETLIEPFAGSAAITIAAAAHNLAGKFMVNDFNEPLIKLWREIIDAPEKLARQYETLWREQHAADREAVFMTRCGKSLIKTRSRTGCFICWRDASKPPCVTMPMASLIKALTIAAMASSPARCARISWLHRRFCVAGPSASLDYKEIVERPTTEDLVYLDPPYQGVCGERDPRYLESILFSEFVAVLETLNARDISYLVSYDGRTGDKVHGQRLPPHLRLQLVELEAGRSSQATLLGRDEITVESLYLSRALAGRLEIRRVSQSAGRNN